MSNEEETEDLYQQYQQRLQEKQEERKNKRAAKKRRTFRVFLKMLLMAFIIVLSYHIIYMKSWRLPANILCKYNNDSLIITNNKIVPSYKIFAAIRQIDLPNKAIFLVNTDEIRKNIMTLDPIQDVYVRRFWFPARLNIIIKEHTPTILIAPNEKVQPIAYFTKEGKLIGREYMPLRGSYKTIKVLAYCTKDNDYRKWELDQLNLIRKFAKTIEMYSNQKVQYIDMRNPNDVYVKIDSVLLRVGALDIPTYEELLVKISKLPSLLPQVDLLDKNIKYLDLRWDNVYYVKLSDDTEDKDKNKGKKKN